jgi:insulysin
MRLFMRMYLKSFVTVLALSFVISCSNEQSSTNTVLKNNDMTISGGTVSEINLPNGVRAMVISLPGAKQPNLSVSIGVGSAHDPVALPGLAHFVEHMLFLGTKDYPNSLELSQLVEANEGYKNAYTAQLHTNYQLTTNTETFPEAIKRYSRFFVNPLFTASLVEKEKNAIQNEYVMRFDVFKLYRGANVLYTGADSSSSAFNIGNTETLKNATAEDAVNFYNKYYSSKNMTIILTGPQDVATLKALIQNNFSDVPARDVTLPELPKPVAFTNKLLKRNTPEAEQSLDVTFQIEETKNSKVMDALSVIGSIIGDESAGSLQSILQNQGLAPQRAGVVSASIGGNEIHVSVKLTKDGAQNYQQVMSYVKGFVEFIKTQPEPRYILDESNGLKKIVDLNADYTDLSVDQISSINDDYNSGDTAKKIFSSSPSLSYETSDYQAALTLLKTKSVQAVLTTNDDQASDLYKEKFAKTIFNNAHKIQIVKLDNKEYVVDGHYQFASIIEDIHDSNIKSLSSSDFALPVKNSYIPTQFQLKSEKQLENVKTLSMQNIDVFHNAKSDITLPKTTTSIYMFSPNVDFTNKKDVVHLILMKNWILSSMTPSLYPFTVAGAEQAFNVMIGQKALRITLSSWNDTSDIILKDYLKLISLSKNEIGFQKFKQVTMISLQQQLQSADAQASNVSQSTYMEWPVLQEYKDIVDQTSLKDIESMYTRFFSKFYTQAVVSGHYSGKESIAIVDALTTSLPTAAMSKDELATFKKLSTEKTVDDLVQVTIDQADTEASLVVDFYHLGTTSKKEMLMSQLLGDWIGPDFYYELRTQQQLAYSLWAGHITQGKYFGLYMTLESSSASSDQVEEAMRTFLINWVNNVLPIKEQKDINAFLAKEKSLEENRQKIIDQDAANQKFLDFNWVFEGEKENITFTMEEMIALAKQKLINNPTGLLIKVKSNAEKEQSAKTGTLHHHPH